jgi:competence protein ComFC
MGNGIAKTVKQVLNSLASVIYPSSNECILCGVEEEHELICRCCKNKVKLVYIEDVIVKDDCKIKFFSAAYYSSSVKELILRFKYRSDFEAGDYLAQVLEDVVVRKKLQFDAITYVPSGRSAEAKRGYNQSKYLAKVLGDSTEKPVLCCLRKKVETKDQIGLDGEHRWNNLRDSFDVKDSRGIKNKKILLVDDVITTGATAFYGSKLLLNAGCSEVIVLTVAKSRL